MTSLQSEQLLHVSVVCPAGGDMNNRRDFLKVSTFAAGSMLLPSKWISRPFDTNGGVLDPATVPKYTMPLVIPPAMPRTRRILQDGIEIDYYSIAVRQFEQQILPAGMPSTTVWSYGSVHDPATFNYPAFTIEARYSKPVRVKWINNLKDAKGNFLPHLLPVDPTLHWANPPGPIDSHPTFSRTPGPYTGPVPIVTHVHGAHSAEESDGYAEAWYLPHAHNIPPGYSRVGSWYEIFKEKFQSQFHQPWTPGSAVFQYQNDQAAATIWYHDHSLGMTRLNVYAGPAGFFLLRGGSFDLPDGVLPGPAPTVGSSPFGRFYEIPLAIQDRSFNLNGSLFYPDSRVFFDDFGGPYIPNSDIAPIYNPEFFGNTIVVNGRTWPLLEVEPRRYRLRFLNGCDSRTLILKLVTDAQIPRPATPVIPFWQIGSEGGFLPKAVQLPQLLLSLAERADVIVDFSSFPVGTEVYLINEGPDEPFGGGAPFEDFEPADPSTTGQVMKFRVVAPSSTDSSVSPENLTLPSPPPLGSAIRNRQLSLNELDSDVLPGVGPRVTLLGTVNNGVPIPRMWDDPITENPRLNDTEIWELFNFTADAHPIHIHELQFQVVNRQALETDGEGITLIPASFAGAPIAPEPWESGFKDTVLAYPGQVTRVKAKFDLPGRYVWHCHIVSHEDNEMMRPYQVGQ
jgi:spore coat protein A, manganese oxidase